MKKKLHYFIFLNLLFLTNLYAEFSLEDFLRAQPRDRFIDFARTLLPHHPIFTFNTITNDTHYIEGTTIVDNSFEDILIAYVKEFRKNNHTYRVFTPKNFPIITYFTGTVNGEEKRIVFLSQQDSKEKIIHFYSEQKNKDFIDRNPGFLKSFPELNHIHGKLIHKQEYDIQGFLQAILQFECEDRPEQIKSRIKKLLSARGWNFNKDFSPEDPQMSQFLDVFEKGPWTLTLASQAIDENNESILVIRIQNDYKNVLPQST